VLRNRRKRERGGESQIAEKKVRRPKGAESRSPLKKTKMGKGETPVKFWGENARYPSRSHGARWEKTAQELGGETGSVGGKRGGGNRKNEKQMEGG